MSRSISNRIRQAVGVLNGTIQLDSMIPMQGFVDVKVVRSDGRIETKTLRNTVTVVGLNRIASSTVNSAAGVLNSIVIGSATASPALTDSQSTIGEVGPQDIGGGRRQRSVARMDFLCGDLGRFGGRHHQRGAGQCGSQHRCKFACNVRAGQSRERSGRDTGQFRLPEPDGAYPRGIARCGS